MRSLPTKGASDCIAGISNDGRSDSGSGFDTELVQNGFSLFSTGFNLDVLISH